MRGSQGSARSRLEKPWDIVRDSRVATVRGLATRARRAIQFTALSPGVIPARCRTPQSRLSAGWSVGRDGIGTPSQTAIGRLAPQFRAGETPAGERLAARLRRTSRDIPEHSGTRGSSFAATRLVSDAWTKR